MHVCIKYVEGGNRHGKRTVVKKNHTFIIFNNKIIT